MLLACLDITDAFYEALQHYILFLKLPWKLEKFDEGKTYAIEEKIIILAHNHTPEELTISSRLLAVRNSASLCATPIIFVTETLSPHVSPLFVGKEFIWECPLPFNSAKFLELVSTVEKFKQSNRDVLILRTMIQGAIGRADFNEASELLDQIDDTYPHPFQIHMLNAQVAIELGKLENAEGFLERACAISDAFEANSQLAKVYMLRNKKEEFQRTMDKTMKAAEAYVKNLIHWGNIYLERGDGQRSQTAFERALEKDPNNIEAQEGLLAANLMNGQVEMADKIIQNSPHSLELARLCNLKGIAMAKSGSFAAAEKLYKNALKFLPEAAVAYKLWFNLGLCLKAQEDYEKALYFFGKAKENAPESFGKVDAQIRSMKEFIKLEEAERAKREKQNQKQVPIR